MIPKETQEKLDEFWATKNSPMHKVYYEENLSTVVPQLLKELQAHIEKMEKQLGVAEDALRWYSNTDKFMEDGEYMKAKLHHTAVKALREIEEMK